jgi:hypothetical protein
MAADPYPDMHCVICGAEFLIADSHARIDANEARMIGRRAGDPVCCACWNNLILRRPDGSPHTAWGNC